MLENKTAPDVYMWCCGTAVTVAEARTRLLTAIHVENVCRYTSTLLYVLNSSSSGLWAIADSFSEVLSRHICCYLNGDFRKSHQKKNSLLIYPTCCVNPRDKLRRSQFIITFMRIFRFLQRYNWGFRSS